MKTYKIVAEEHGVYREFFTGLTLKNAEELYDCYGGVIRDGADGTGFEWELYIEEEGE